jgi:hypothetical protein
MIRFLLLILAFIALQLPIGAMVFRPEPNHYLAAIAAKQARLETAPSPRAIFVGGSNLAFGLNSGMFEAETGLNPVNMGLDAGLNVRFMLDQVEPWIRKGDVVILSLEYNQFNHIVPSTRVTVPLMEFRPGLLLELDWKTAKQTADTIVTYLRERARRSVLGEMHVWVAPYSADSFNEYGDADGHYGLPGTDFTTFSVQVGWEPGTGFDEALEVLNAFAATCRARGVRPMLFHPVITPERYAEARPRLEGLHRALTERLDMPVMNTPASAVMAREMFYNTVYHLTEEGIRKRTSIYTEAIRR